MSGARGVAQAEVQPFLAQDDLEGVRGSDPTPTNKLEVPVASCRSRRSRCDLAVVPGIEAGPGVGESSRDA